MRIIVNLEISYRVILEPLINAELTYGFLSNHIKHHFLVTFCNHMSVNVAIIIETSPEKKFEVNLQSFNGQQRI